MGIMYLRMCCLLKHLLPLPFNIQCAVYGEYSKMCRYCFVCGFIIHISDVHNTCVKMYILTMSGPSLKVYVYKTFHDDLGSPVFPPTDILVLCTYRQPSTHGLCYGSVCLASCSIWVPCIKGMLPFLSVFWWLLALRGAYHNN